VIEVRFPLTHRNQQQFKVSGHGEAGPKGSDLVCSAVSTLVLTMLGGLESELGAVIRGEVTPGNCDVTIEVPEPQAHSLRQVVGVFRFGFKRLAESYPDNISWIS
jgi:uncharacterized protein YsxB (DUF464 family)